MELSLGTKKLVEEYKAWYQSLEPKGTVATITVDEVAARVAAFYEKIRGVVDWREEHLLRKTAIERMLKRRFMLAGNGENIAEALLHELVRSGHFPNERIPVEKIDETQRIINKYSALIAQKKEVDWLLTICACEIEETLSPRQRERALIECMTHDMQDQIRVRKRDEHRISEQDRMSFIYVGVQRALFKLDDATISLHLLSKFYPNWAHLSATSVSLLALDTRSIKKTIQSILLHPFAEKFYRIIERYDTPYLLLGDIISEDPNTFDDLVLKVENFEEAIKKVYNIRLIKLKDRVNRASFFSTLSVFLSKVLVGLAIELPLDMYVTHELSYINLAWSIAIPPVFLLILIKTVKSSTSENVQRTLLAVAKITFENNQREAHEILIPRQRNFAIGFILNLVYIMSFVLSFGLLAGVLRSFGFSIPSIAVFLVFFSLVTFGATKIRARARELIVGNEKQGFLHGVMEFFGLPVIQVGKWLSGQISKYNVLIVLLNVLIEAPFQIFVEFIEQLRTFWQEKKEQIR